MTDNATPSSGHTMRVTLEYDRITLTPICHEPEGAICRVTCAADDPCESFEYPDHEHGLRPLKYCNAVEYLTGDYWPEELCGDKGVVSLYDGMPIEVKWDGDSYTWSAVKAATVAS